MRNLFWDLLIRMAVIVTIFDVLAYYYLAVRQRPWTPLTLAVLIILEVVVITISLWFDIRYRKLKDERMGGSSQVLEQQNCNSSCSIALSFIFAACVEFGEEALMGATVTAVALIILAIFVLATFSAISELQHQVSTLRVEVSSLQDQIAADNTTISQLQATVISLSDQSSTFQSGLEHQRSQVTVKIWSISVGINSKGWLVEGVPDTFDLYVSFSSTVPVTVYFLTLNQYVQFANANGSISAVSGKYLAYPPTVAMKSVVFKLAEGCGAYLMVLQSLGDGTLYPNIFATYNPALYLTGVCATGS